MCSWSKGFVVIRLLICVYGDHMLVGDLVQVLDNGAGLRVVIPAHLIVSNCT